ncbi:unknown [[Mannheimia] succiniciproducens MBEL55E]|uniref:Uncharacterized protein n=1 Tax=Mannheimia succiniciproducens (strain KCTC 0769BP / MBEL55E) TaxID=221988 RepID=Q65VK1_MANSM|nr:unknown [[Mannheimia] succiniciproducens MBEL55E]
MLNKFRLNRRNFFVLIPLIKADKSAVVFCEDLTIL